MPDIFNFSPDMDRYFSTLPAPVQETIRKSNLKISSLEDLQCCAENIAGEHPDYFWG